MGLLVCRHIRVTPTSIVESGRKPIRPIEESIILIGSELPVEHPPFEAGHFSPVFDVRTLGSLHRFFHAVHVSLSTCSTRPTGVYGFVAHTEGLFLRMAGE